MQFNHPLMLPRVLVVTSMNTVRRRGPNLQATAPAPAVHQTVTVCDAGKSRALSSCTYPCGDDLPDSPTLRRAPRVRSTWKLKCGLAQNEEPASAE